MPFAKSKLDDRDLTVSVGAWMNKKAKEKSFLYYKYNGLQNWAKVSDLN